MCAQYIKVKKKNKILIYTKKIGIGLMNTIAINEE